MKNLKDLEAAADRLGGTLVLGQKKIKWYGSFVDDSTEWKTFFDEETAKKIAAMPRDARVKIITDYMTKCDHAIKFPGINYEVGVVAAGDGSFRLRYDYYDSGLKAKLGGKNAGKLAQAYALEAAKRAAKLKGWMTKEVAQKGGSVKLEVYAT